jgi:hypothetical protein
MNLLHPFQSQFQLPFESWKSISFGLLRTFGGSNNLTVLVHKHGIGVLNIVGLGKQRAMNYPNIDHDVIPFNSPMLEYATKAAKDNREKRNTTKKVNEFTFSVIAQCFYESSIKSTISCCF